jgi:hypothetical protein
MQYTVLHHDRCTVHGEEQCIACDSGYEFESTIELVEEIMEEIVEEES